MPLPRLRGDVNEKLDFILRFHSAATQGLQGKIAAIENGEIEPEDDFDPEVDGLPNQIAHYETTQFLDLQGNCCLGLVQAVLKQFLKEFIEQLGLKPPSGTRGSWFDNYTRLLATEFQINWTEAPVDLVFLEDVNLARNSFEHAGRLDSNHAWQSEDHSTRFPDSAFQFRMFDGRMKTQTLAVDSHSLLRSVNEVKAFAGFLVGVVEERRTVRQEQLRR